MKAIYLDYAATTPVDPRVAARMVECLTQEGVFGNPASQHVYGYAASKVVEQARAQVAQAVHAETAEIIWTSGATESNNLAIKGVAHFYQKKGRHIITSPMEHKAVLDPIQALVDEGFEVTYLTADSKGLLDPEELKHAIRPDTILVSIMQANNEIGVIQDIATLGKITREKQLLFHVDAAQSAGKIPIDLSVLPVDLMSFSAHKFYGPKGAGALFVRRRPRARLIPLFHGGGHEQGLRSGTLATHQIVGMAEALSLAVSDLEQEQARLLDLRLQIQQALFDLGGITFNGDLDRRLAGYLSVSVEGVEGESLLLGLRDLAISTGSACTSATIAPSHVLKAIGLGDDAAHRTLRITLGRFTTQAEVEVAIGILRKTIRRLRSLSP